MFNPAALISGGVILYYINLTPSINNLNNNTRLFVFIDNNSIVKGYRFEVVCMYVFNIKRMCDFDVKFIYGFYMYD